MSWTKKNMHPGKIVSTSQEVEVQVLEVDSVKRRISLGLKQTMRNPWGSVHREIPGGSTVEGEVKTRPSSACSSGSTATSTAWCICPTSTEASGRAGDRQLQEGRHGQGHRARCRCREGTHLARRQAAGRRPVRRTRRRQEGRGGDLRSAGSEGKRIEVQISGTDFTTFIKRSELARRALRSARRAFAVGEKVDARVIQFDKKARKVQVSIKALEVAEEKEAIAQYGSSDSGATLGDILGTALKGRAEK